MLRSLRVRISQGRQYIADLRAASPTNYRGMPSIAPGPCPDDCRRCAEACPAQAFVDLAPLTIDLGRCTLCGDCEPACPEHKLSFSNACHTAALARSDLHISAARPSPPAIAVQKALKEQFGRSLRLRSVSAGGCNGCEAELNAAGNVNFDMGRFGIEFVASPRHADGLVISGPITRNMAEPLQLCYDAMPRPRFVIAYGACAISGGVFAEAPQLERQFVTDNTPVLLLPGCPPHPLTFVVGLMDLLGIQVAK